MISGFIGILTNSALAYVFSMQPNWYLVLAAGMVGGFFFRHKRWAFPAVGAGVGLGWLVYIWRQDAWLMLNQVAEIITGSKEQGVLIAGIVVGIGIIMGALGGSVGCGLRQLATGKTPQ